MVKIFERVGNKGGYAAGGHPKFEGNYVTGRLWSAKTSSAGFQRNVALLHPDRPGWSGVSLFFLNVADFKGAWSSRMTF
jgi:hypothetical protein